MTRLEQQYAGLAKGTAVQVERARVKRAVRAGTVTLVEALDCECCQTMTIYDLVRVRFATSSGFGRRRTLGLLAAAGSLGVPIPEHKQVGSLTDRQKQALIEACSETERSAA